VAGGVQVEDVDRDRLADAGHEDDQQGAVPARRPSWAAAVAPCANRASSVIQTVGAPNVPDRGGADWLTITSLPLNGFT
jgi:hypothetical protein